MNDTYKLFNIKSHLKRLIAPIFTSAFLMGIASTEKVLANPTWKLLQSFDKGETIQVWIKTDSILKTNAFGTGNYSLIFAVMYPNPAIKFEEHYHAVLSCGSGRSRGLLFLQKHEAIAKPGVNEIWPGVPKGAFVYERTKTMVRSKWPPSAWGEGVKKGTRGGAVRDYVCPRR